MACYHLLSLAQHAQIDLSKSTFHQCQCSSRLKQSTAAVGETSFLPIPSPNFNSGITEPQCDESREGTDGIFHSLLTLQAFLTRVRTQGRCLFLTWGVPALQACTSLCFSSKTLNIQPKTTSGLPMNLSKAVKCVLISCHAISVCLYLVRAQAIYNFALNSQAICSSIEFCDTFYCEQASPTN